MAEIGKNVIENLTTAMYENAYTVYREYIQNLSLIHISSVRCV